MRPRTEAAGSARPYGGPPRALVWPRWLLLVLLIVGLASTGCAAMASSPTASPALSRIALTSPAFPPGGTVPVEATCDGADRSPSLSWSELPTGTVALVLIVEDPNAPGGTFTHWLLYDLPAELRSLPSGVPPQPTLSDGARQGRNDFGTLGYRGPCPPPSLPHRYVFRLYALDAPTGLPPGVRRDEVLRRIEGHVLGVGELVGTYRR
ncbi:MAG: YbhB/YbcL family Raf kinase inhibitor-like protein [Thermomicrobium sp.]|nr:YbhB/YbcL family Raf kinase inhibitor-like protein [Thermomicrobium sp.]MDW8059427.1 YbhB/YbcL family Raf kinase inhibitor-like protein [Thermomicrobium sp.]